MRKITEEDFSAVDFLADFIRSPLEVQEQFVQALGYTLGWHSESNRWKRILVDSDGRQLVSTSPTKSNTCSHSNPTVTSSSSTILSQNSDRKQVIIQNVGAYPVYIRFGSSAAQTTDFKLVAGATYIDDVYYGELRAVSDLNDVELNIMEFS